MAEFQVRVRILQIEEHPNADAIEIAKVDGYLSVVQKGQFHSGDCAAYIPENSIIPGWLIQEMGVEEKLAGPEHNRVKAIHLRGVLSQGLVWPVPGAEPGEDVAERLGITKYIPKIPEHMQGEMYPAPGMTVSFDVQDIKSYPRALIPGEEIVATEKLHGTYCQLGYAGEHPIITSKKPASTGLAYQDSGANDGNVYVQAGRRNRESIEALRQDIKRLEGEGNPSFFLMGEIYGIGVQDLQYDTKQKEFRVFDLYLGDPSEGRYLNYDEMVQLVEPHFDVVPLVYRGEYQPERLEAITTGTSLVAKHRREGVVIKPVQERIDLELGRVILKSVSGKHILRKGNPTEYE